MNKKTIHVAYAINEGYIDYCNVSMLSLLTNNRSANVHFHILTGKISQPGINRLEEVVKSNGGEITVHEAPVANLSNLKLNGFHLYIWLRVFLPELLDESIDRVLYLDTDTIICGDITNLFSLNLDGYSVAGCMDYLGYSDGVYNRLNYPREYGYICSGVMVMNLKYFREHNLTCKIIDYAATHADVIVFPDQDAINAICHKTTLHLPLKYDILLPFFTDKDFAVQHHAEVKEMLEDPRVIHYAGCNPWKKENRRKHYYDDEYWKYANQLGQVKRRWTKSGIPLLKQFAFMILGQLGVARYSQFRMFQRYDYSAIEQIKREVR